MSSANCAFRLCGKWLEFLGKLNGLFEPLGVTVRAIKLVGQVEKGRTTPQLPVQFTVAHGRLKLQWYKVTEAVTAAPPPCGRTGTHLTGGV